MLVAQHLEIYSFVNEMRPNWQSFDPKQYKNLQSHIECVREEQHVSDEIRKESIRVSLVLRHKRLAKESGSSDTCTMRGKMLTGILHSNKSYERRVKQIFRHTNYKLTWNRFSWRNKKCQLRGTPDGFLHSEFKRRDAPAVKVLFPVDIKCSKHLKTAETAKEWAKSGKGWLKQRELGGWTVRESSDCFKQLQMYMAIMDTKKAYVCTAIGDRAVMIQVCRDTEYVEKITEEVHRYMTAKNGSVRRGHSGSLGVPTWGT